jgi:hypothetical protein
MIRRTSQTRCDAMPAAPPASLRNFGEAPALSRALALGLALCPVVTPAADAQAPRHARGYAYITVESRYGTATVTAAVRQGPSGRLEVRLPGGTWIECRQSCHDTLRRETVDFWQNHGPPRSGGDGPGYLHFEF